jgi:hypothetical protein
MEKRLKGIEDWIYKAIPLDINIIGYLGNVNPKPIQWMKRNYIYNKKRKGWVPCEEFITPSSKNKENDYFVTEEYALELFFHSPVLFFIAAHLDVVFLTLTSSPQEALIAAISEEIVTDTFKYRFDQRKNNYSNT